MNFYLAAFFIIFFPLVFHLCQKYRPKFSRAFIFQVSTNWGEADELAATPYVLQTKGDAATQLNSQVTLYVHTQVNVNVKVKV